MNDQFKALAPGVVPAGVLAYLWSVLEPVIAGFEDEIDWPALEFAIVTGYQSGLSFKAEAVRLLGVVGAAAAKVFPTDPSGAEDLQMVCTAAAAILNFV